MIRYRLTLDVKKPFSSSSVALKQGDSAGELHFRLRNGSEDLDPTGCFAVLTGRKESGTVFEYGAVNEDGIVKFPLAPLVTSTAGKSECEIRLFTPGGELKHSAAFTVEVFPSLDGAVGEEAEESEITTLAQLTAMAFEAKNSATAAAERALSEAYEADESAERANGAAASASAAAEEANTAASGARSAAQLAEVNAHRAEDAATEAESAAGSANTASARADHSAADADLAAVRAGDAAIGASHAKEGANAAALQASSAALAASEASSNASYAASLALDKAQDADEAAAAANEAAACRGYITCEIVDEALYFTYHNLTGISFALNNERLEVVYSV